MGSSQRHRRSGRAEEAVTGVVWGSQQAVPEPYSPAPYRATATLGPLTPKTECAGIACARGARTPQEPVTAAAPAVPGVREELVPHKPPRCRSEQQPRALRSRKEIIPHFSTRESTDPRSNPDHSRGRAATVGKHHHATTHAGKATLKGKT